MKIRLENITKKYGDFVALDNVSFSCEDGEFFSVLGKSGSGKTTLIRIIAGLEKPDSGKVFFNDQDIAILPPHKRYAVMVFQNYALFPHLDVFENVAFGLRERRMPSAEIQKRVSETLRTLNIEDKIRREVSELSGGEQQRVALARALALDSRVILFDEPLSNLDVVLRRELQKELKALQRETGRNFIYITHDQEEALMLSDKLMVLERGSVRELGTPVEVYESPKSLFGASFIGLTNVLKFERAGKNSIKTETGLTLSLETEPTGDEFDVVIRAEHIKPSCGNAEKNAFHAKIKASYFKGSFFEYAIDVQGIRMTMIATEHLKKEVQICIKKFFIFSDE
ncbi:ABC transporter-related protein [Chloroherpeton thalassium ATCC 35110]|uniref:ABC transporter-related protein n=1 Tax=Chloroherpeton thalassium (strain ATCC 35110 / GB-78) TaxID=517418 RepID=B3QZ01_CHLT3|nr:ABC transporter ATP-binding protein [Chloroherpeton thalassium]ACF13694.1 ABC transporter-related protein [Chloroherpeton thalassium ATCC 35110]